MSAAPPSASCNPSGAWGEPHDELWQRLGWQPNPQQLAQFQALQEELRRWNARVNLTRLVEGADFWIAQVFDSLWPLLPLLRDRPDTPLRCIDVGTGGGFPGLAAAIALPRAQLTLVDSVGRKTQAVQAMAQALGLGDRVELRCERVELTGRDRRCRGSFDQWGPADDQELERAAKLLKARVSRRDNLDLPADRGQRTVLGLRPVAACPATYPRAVGIPAKFPLGAG